MIESEEAADRADAEFEYRLLNAPMEVATCGKCSRVVVTGDGKHLRCLGCGEETEYESWSQHPGAYGPEGKRQ